MSYMKCLCFFHVRSYTFDIAEMFKISKSNFFKVDNNYIEISLCQVRSPLLMASRLIFLHGTKMFHFPYDHCLNSMIGIPIMVK